jgi:hypothetical protein
MLAERTGQSLQETFPDLTRVSCECCGGVFVDEVALLVIEDALIAYREALVEKREADAGAWADAYAAVDQAQRATTGG